jgi:chloramphenicol 3-O phosphotransferase
MDSFINMLPDGYWNHPDGFAFETIEEDGLPAVIVKTGPVGERLVRGRRRAVAAMAAAGNELIVDDVLMDGAADDYAALLAVSRSTGSACSPRSTCWRRASGPAATG